MSALNAASGGEIDDRVVGRREDIAGADDVGAAEEHNAITIGVGSGMMYDVDAFAIEVQLLLILTNVRWASHHLVTALADRWARSCASERYCAQEWRAVTSVFDIAGDIAADDGVSGHADFLVTASMVGMIMRVDDVADRTVGDRFDGRQNLVGHRGESGVDKQHAVFSGLHGDVAARARQS